MEIELERELEESAIRLERELEEDARSSEGDRRWRRS
jgi:hypothetical protein